jgi:hypothetical protein
MAKWWMGMALAAVVAGQHNAALAQYPEPVPCGPSTAGNSVVAGPLPSTMAPPGPGPDLSISANAPGAFSCDDYCHEFGCYYHAGCIMFQAARPTGHTLVAFKDPGIGTDTGIRPTDPAITNNAAITFNSVVPAFEFGVSGGVGITMDEWAVEAYGYYIPLQGATRTSNNPGMLDLNFINPPMGFEGDSGLWLQADQVKIRDSFLLVDGELNLRYDGGCLIPLVGFRYFQVRERMSIFTDDDGLTFPDINGNPNPVLQATYRINQRSQIYAGQLGLEAQLPACGCFVFGASVKGAYGENHYEKTTTLFRGDGLLGFESHTSHEQFSQIYDVGFYLDYYCHEHCRLRAGYNLLWVVNVPVAKDQIDFDLSNENGTVNKHGTLFFHGPQIELQFMF